MKNDLNQTKAFLFDLDGTLYLGNNVFDGVKETLDYIRDKGIKIVYLTNNSSKTEKEYKAKLIRLGLFDKRDIIYSSLDASIEYITEMLSGKKIYAVATKKVAKYLKKAGINLSDNADAVLVTFDTELNYKKIEKANDLIVKGATYIATHPDKTCPKEGVYSPDLGSFIEMFKASSNKYRDIIIGKPNAVMGDCIYKELNLHREQITIVGDRLSTDIAFGINSGFNTVLVFSGETEKDAYAKSDIKADFALDTVNGIKELI